MTGLTESERETLANTIRWHMNCEVEQPGRWQSLCIANVERTVEQIIEARVVAERERFDRSVRDGMSTGSFIVDETGTYIEIGRILDLLDAARIARQEPQNAAQDGRGGLE